jgi:hypothetical protein
MNTTQKLSNSSNNNFLLPELNNKDPKSKFPFSPPPIKKKKHSVLGNSYHYKLPIENETDLLGKNSFYINIL